MQPIRTIWIILVEDQQGTIPVEFGYIPISSAREEVVRSFPYIIQCKSMTPPPSKVNFNPWRIIWTTLVDDL